MCIICAQWNKGKLTDQEALRNVGELIGGSKVGSKEREHYQKVAEKIVDRVMGPDLLKDPSEELLSLDSDEIEEEDEECH